MSFPIKSGGSLHTYVSLPEGSCHLLLKVNINRFKVNHPEIALGAESAEPNFGVQERARRSGSHSGCLSDKEDKEDPL